MCGVQHATHGRGSILIVLQTMPEGYDRFLQTMFEHQLFPQELPTGFLHAIHHVLLTWLLSNKQPLIDLMGNGIMLGLASQELLFLMRILRQRRELIIWEAARRDPAVWRNPGMSVTWLGALFISNTMQLRERITSSDLLVLTLRLLNHLRLQGT